MPPLTSAARREPGNGRQLLASSSGSAGLRRERIEAARRPRHCRCSSDRTSFIISSFGSRCRRRSSGRSRAARAAVLPTATRPGSRNATRLGSARAVPLVGDRSLGIDDHADALVVLDRGAVLAHQRLDLHVVEAAPRQHERRSPAALARVVSRGGDQRRTTRSMSVSMLMPVWSSNSRWPSGLRAAALAEPLPERPRS